MKVVILAGGFGTRISEEGSTKPKPMIEIGDKPILWHIMKIFSQYGLNEFIICCGYKQNVIKEWFTNYYININDFSLDLEDGNKISFHNQKAEPWKITFVDTGYDTMTGGRVKRIQKYISDETFMLTYGDAVSDINILDLYNFHKQNGKIATITAVQPEGRFGILELSENDVVKGFREKERSDMEWINAGFMVLEPGIFDLIEEDDTVLEKEPMKKLASMGELVAYRHNGFWQCMDIMRDKERLDCLWKNNSAPWKTWE